MNAVEDFRALRFLAPGEATSPGKTPVLAPIRWRFGDGGEARELGVIMANGDVNEALLSSLPEPDRATPGTIAAVFAADPFAIWDDIATALGRAGIGSVMNYPTMGVHEGPLAEGFEAMNTGHGAEIDRLDWFRQKGFEVVALACSPGQVEQAARCRPRAIVLHAFVATAGPADDEFVKAAATAAGCPILLHGNGWSASSRERADGTLA